MWKMCLFKDRCFGEEVLASDAGAEEEKQWTVWDMD
jgi:hypothetical protein